MFFSGLIVYLCDKKMVLLTLFASFLIFFIVFNLYSLPPEAVIYAHLLVGILILIIGSFGFFRHSRRLDRLKKIKSNIGRGELKMPRPVDAVEKSYQELATGIDFQLKTIISQKDRDTAELLDYYTLWVHQIKNPIAAMRLLLQSSAIADSEELLDELFKIEQYVAMVLQYLRLKSNESDFLFQRYSLAAIVKGAIKKHARFFIGKNIKLNYSPFEQTVLTDEKWLSFVIEQVLANALKYTPQGSISIYATPGTAPGLVIEDTGIGIRKEDLPRIFSRGFTGHIGRLDKKATGLGLFLCKEIIDKLGHTIEAQSTVGKGTKIFIGFPQKELALD